jgi:DNA-binding NtrC family response regulator
MRLLALRYRLGNSTSDPLEVSSWSGTPHDLATDRTPGVYVVEDDGLAALRRFPLFSDRGKKHEARPLSAILLGHPRVPLVEASYVSGQAMRKSVRTLLLNARDRGERRAYVIGVPARAFEEAAARVRHVVGEQRSDGADTGAPDPVLVDPVEVPRELEDQVIGESSEMHIVRQWIVRAAQHDEPVLILGETGTGKEVVARAIHQFSPERCSKHFLSVNCGAIPDQLFETELFGYMPHSFTGAHPKGSEGLWRHAKGGTIFLDEIADLATHHQVKLLRALQERKIRPVGSLVEFPVNARVIAATNKDLTSMVELGEFREDLYYRIGSMFITLPPLRDRPEDVASLATHFWKEVAPLRAPLSEEVIQELRQYRWRGNARELRYVLANLHTTFQKPVPTVEHVRAVVRMRAPRKTAGDGDGVEQTLRHVEYLRHLRRARAAIDGCRRTVQGLGRRSLDEDKRARILAEVGGCLTELQLLGTRPERFENLATFEMTHRLAGGLAAFQSLLLRNDPGAVRYGRKELNEEVAAAGVAVRREEERMLKLI